MRRTAVDQATMLKDRGNYRNKPSLMDTESTFSSEKDPSLALSTASDQLALGNTDKKSSYSNLAYSVDSTTVIDEESIDIPVKPSDKKEKKKELSLDEVGEAVVDAGKELWQAVENFFASSSSAGSERSKFYYNDESTNEDTSNSSAVNEAYTMNDISTINDSKCDTIYEERDETSFPKKRQSSDKLSSKSSGSPSKASYYQNNGGTNTNQNCKKKGTDGRETKAGKDDRLVSKAPIKSVLRNGEKNSYSKSSSRLENKASIKSKSGKTKGCNNGKPPIHDKGLAIPLALPAMQSTRQPTSFDELSQSSSLSLGSMSLKKGGSQVIIKTTQASPFVTNGKLVLATVKTGITASENNNDNSPAKSSSTSLSKTSISSNNSKTSTNSKENGSCTIKSNENKSSSKSNILKNVVPPFLRKSSFRSNSNKKSLLPEDNHFQENTIPGTGTNLSLGTSSVGNNSNKNNKDAPLIRVRQRSSNNSVTTSDFCDNSVSSASTLKSYYSTNTNGSMRKRSPQSKIEAAIHFSTPMNTVSRGLNSKKNISKKFHDTYESEFLSKMQKEKDEEIINANTNEDEDIMSSLRADGVYFESKERDSNDIRDYGDYAFL